MRENRPAPQNRTASAMDENRELDLQENKEPGLPKNSEQENDERRRAAEEAARQVAVTLASENRRRCSEN